MNKTSDYELTEDALNTIDTFIKDNKNNNNSVILRFEYDNWNGVNKNNGEIDGNGYKVEPSIDMILKHIEQMTPIFNKYHDAILNIQIGFLGSNGELHDSTMCTKENINLITEKLLNNTADDITISLRTPTQFANFLGISIDSIDAFIDSKENKSYRLGIYNDGYLGSSSDLGTFKNREKEVMFLSNHALHTPYGGEAVINYDENAKVDGYTYIGKYSLMENLEKEIYKTHTNHLNYEWNQNLHQEWKLKLYTGENEVYKNANKSDFQFINDHLGYRFVVRKNEINHNIYKKGVLLDKLTIENTGFGNMIKDKKVKAIITDLSDNILSEQDVSIDLKDFKSKETITKQFSLNIKEGLKEGEYKLYLRIYTGLLDDGSIYLPVRLANDNIYNDLLNANYIGKFNVILEEKVKNNSNNSEDKYNNSSSDKNTTNSNNTTTKQVTENMIDTKDDNLIKEDNTNKSKNQNTNNDTISNSKNDNNTYSKSTRKNNNLKKENNKSIKMIPKVIFTIIISLLVVLGLVKYYSVIKKEY